MFTREELITIQEKVRKEVGFGQKNMNPLWKRALEDLGYAANVLDAHIRRSQLDAAELKAPVESVPIPERKPAL